MQVLGRLGSSQAPLKQKYDRTIRNRAAVHTLPKKSSEQLVQRYQTVSSFRGRRWR